MPLWEAAVNSPVEIRQLNTRVVYRNRWMTVREDEIERSDGSNGLYGVVEKPAFAEILAMSNQGIFLVEQYRYPVGRRFWELPQGSWEDREVDAADLARAELREETGLVAGSVRHVGHLFLAYGFCTQEYDVYLARDLVQGEPEREPEEQGLVVKAFAVEEIEDMIRCGEIQDATSVAAFSLARLNGYV